MLSWKDNGVEKTPILHTDNNSNPVYSYTGTKNDTELTNKYPDVAYSKCKLPSLLTEAGMLDYKVCYEGNAILIPKEPLTYFTNVQGTLVEVTSDSDVKLQYAVEKSTVGSTKANWILGTNTVKVRLEAEYIYTRLVPMTDGKYEEASFAGELTTANGYKTNKGQYGRSTSITSENDTIIPVYNSEGSKEYYNDYGTFTTVQKDLLNGNTVYIVSNCPVQTVLEKVTFYTDVECYIIDTDMVKNDTSDKNVYLKDYLKDKIATEEFRFVKEKSSFSVKYDPETGFTVKGLSRNSDLKWINGTHIAETVGGYNGELIEWWAGNSATHHYSTPENLNKDINVDRYQDFGVTLHFLDVNRPLKVQTVKIKARTKAPSLSFKNEKGTTKVNGLKKGQTAIRICGTDGVYRALPDELKDPAVKLFGDSYLLTGESATGPKGDQTFWVFQGGSTGKEKNIEITKLFGLTDNKNFNVVEGAYIESQNVGKKNTAPSKISALYVNPQNIFNTSKSVNKTSIVIKQGEITIADADVNNSYEFGVSTDGSEPAKWKTVKTSKPVRDKAIIDGVKVCVRKSPVQTNDKTLFLPSSYVVLEYSGQGKNIPNEYYMDDYLTTGSVTITLENDTKVEMKGVSLQSGAAADIAAGAKKNVTTTTSSTIYRRYISKNRLVNAFAPTSTINVAAGDKVVTLDGIEDSKLKVSEILSRLKEKYGNEWTTAYDKSGITSISVSIASYAEVTPADNDESNKKIFKASDGTEIEYYPVHLLRYMLYN